jgi:hypothetical protein
MSDKPPKATMTHRHSETFLFEIELHGMMHSCSFYLTDTRLITVAVEDRRRTTALGSTPPRVLANAIAAELLLEFESPKITQQTGQTTNWIESVFNRFDKVEHICAHPWTTLLAERY